MQRIIAMAFCLLCLAPKVFAQEQKGELQFQPCQDLSSLPKDCQKQIQKWRKGEKAWRTWVEKYGNQVVRDSLASPAQRPRRPNPPQWLPTACERQLTMHFMSSAECIEYADYLNYDWVEHYKGFEPPIQRVNKGVGESDDIWTWIKRALHADVGWVPTSTNSRFLMLGGVHLALAQVSERIYVFGPGIMIMRVPEARGDHSLRTAQTWGASIRLKDFRVSALKKDYSLYFNFAQFRMSGMIPQHGTGGQSNTGVMGFSIAAKK